MQGRDGHYDPDAESGDTWRIFRRLAHGLVALGAGYYWLPDPLFISFIPRWFGVLAAVILAGAIEWTRLRRRKILPGMRYYEKTRIGSYFYAVTGVAVLLLFFQPYISVPCIIGMAFADPVAGELRIRRNPRWLCFLITGIFYFAIVFISSMIFGGNWFTAAGVLPLSAALAVITTPVALASESIRIKYLDDDFNMLLFPAFVSQIIFFILFSI